MSYEYSENKLVQDSASNLLHKLMNGKNEV